MAHFRQGEMRKYKLRLVGGNTGLPAEVGVLYVGGESTVMNQLKAQTN